MEKLTALRVGIVEPDFSGDGGAEEQNPSLQNLSASPEVGLTTSQRILKFEESVWGLIRPI